ncbi:FliI/YscN family ATPase [Rhodobacterales bacterium LSUCC0031]|nr:FliI/YscN family ATPase [Rhodobacterales bacterium LSUCC0031]
MNAILQVVRSDLAALSERRFLVTSGRVTRFDGQILECDGFPVLVGAVCQVETTGHDLAQAEVIGFRDGRNLLFLYDLDARVEIGARVTPIASDNRIKVGPNLLGRVIDAQGNPLDALGPIALDENWPLMGRPLNPLARRPVAQPLDVGVRVVNALLSVGRGQRLGIVAGSGVGKSVLLSMMTRFSEADVIVMALIGERGREVGAMVEQVMQGEARRKVVVVAVPADRSALLRIRGAHRATAIAEYFRAQGKEVLLIMDSLTRVAHARREVGLALGEQPTAKGYPPSVVSLIPALVERSGTGLQGEGSITSFYTVLADGDDTTNDPVVDTARAILDGHIVLSRRQTQLGIYPAVDIAASVSRVMSDITPNRQQAAAIRFRRLVSLYLENRDLMLMGGYQAGQDPELDHAVALWPKLTAFIKQAPNEPASFDESQKALIALMGE